MDGSSGSPTAAAARQTEFALALEQMRAQLNAELTVRLNELSATFNGVTAQMRQLSPRERTWAPSRP